jgi:hypothetical protein
VWPLVLLALVWWHRRTGWSLERALLVGGLIISGVLAGSPFIVFGQLIEIFLDQRRLLRRIHRELRGPRGAAANPTDQPTPRVDRYPRL